MIEISYAINNYCNTIRMLMDGLKEMKRNKIIAFSKSDVITFWFIIDFYHFNYSHVYTFHYWIENDMLLVKIA